MSVKDRLSYEITVVLTSDEPLTVEQLDTISEDIQEYIKDLANYRAFSRNTSVEIHERF